MKVTVMRDLCCSTGQCELATPEVFGLDDDCVVVVRLPEPPEALHDAVREAARRCPTGTIRIDGQDAG
ncbi:MAG TPA: ferredoxin [Rugosimonospora sp.]|nr:ferredoxin [Rugosimonospora sp.]